MGPQSQSEILAECATVADRSGLDSIWVTDHIAIPPDDAKGSGGRYLDPLITLAWLAGLTSRIRLGTGVLILPYRPALVTAKLVATLQELSGERLILGIGIGWMKAEFKALGKRLSRRAKDSDELLGFLRTAFENDEIELNGQRFLFKPRPTRPPIIVGGRPPHAIERALNLGDGWMPMGMSPEQLRPIVADYRSRARSAGKTSPEVITFTSIPYQDPAAARDRIAEFEDAGVTTLVHGQRYDKAEELTASIEGIQALL